MRLFTYFAMLALVLSCSSINRMAANSSSGVLSEASVEIETEKNWAIFRDGVPANLKTMEGLLYVAPENEKLLLAVMKGYAAYGMGVYETLYMDEQYNGKDETENRENAKYCYTKAINYGLRYLKGRKISYESMVSASRDEGGIEKLFASALNSKNDGDTELVFFLGQAWGSLVNLEKTNLNLLAQLSMIKPLMDWVCNARPDFQYGACDDFYGVYEAGRPKMLGGNPEKGKRHFLKAIEAYPDNLFNRLAYVQFYLVPMRDEEEYKKEKLYLTLAFKDFRDSMVFGKEVSRFTNPRMNILNAIAMKRFEIIVKNERSIF